MKREELKALGLEDANIDAIMKINGVDIEAQKVKTSKAETERDTYKTSLDDTNLELKKFDGLDLEAQKKSVLDLQTKYDTDTKDLQTKLDSQAFNHTAEKFLDSYKFTSPLAKKAALSELLKQELKLDGETILGAKDFMEKMKTDAPTAFVAEENKDEKPPATWGNQTNQNNPPATVEYSFPK